MTNISTDPIIQYYIGELLKINRQKKHKIAIIGGKPTIQYADPDLIEKQIRDNLDAHIKQHYPNMAYYVGAPVSVITDGVTVNGKIALVDGEQIMVQLNNNERIVCKKTDLILR